MKVNVEEKKIDLYLEEFREMCKLMDNGYIDMDEARKWEIHLKSKDIKEVVQLAIIKEILGEC